MRDGRITVVKTDGKDNIADINTKAVNKETLERLRTAAGVVACTSTAVLPGWPTRRGGPSPAQGVGKAMSALVGGPCRSCHQGLTRR